MLHFNNNNNNNRRFKRMNDLFGYLMTPFKFQMLYCVELDDI